MAIFSSTRPTYDHRTWIHPQLCRSMIKSSMMETRHEPNYPQWPTGMECWKILDPSHCLRNRERELQRQRYPRIHRTGFKHWLLPYRHCSMWVMWILNSRSLIIFCYEGYENEESVPIAIRESGLARSELYITSKYWNGNLEGAIRASLNKVLFSFLDYSIEYFCSI